MIQKEAARFLDSHATADDSNLTGKNNMMENCKQTADVCFVCFFKQNMKTNNVENYFKPQT